MELFCSSVVGLFFSKRFYTLLKGSYVYTDIYTSTNGSKRLKEKAQRILHEVDYVPPLYCIFEYHGQLQTFMQFVTRNVTRLCRSYILTPYAVGFERGLLRLPDGGTVALDWARKSNDISNTPSLPLNAPIIIMHHGLVGDSQSEYIYHMAWTLLSAGYRVVVMVARGCGGLELTSGEIFAGRRTSDVANVIDRVKQQYPEAKLFWVGFSLGAALTLQYLAVPHANTPTRGPGALESLALDDWRGPLTAAVSVSPPWNVYVNACSPSYVAYFWMSLIVAPLKAYYLSHRKYLNQVAPSGVGGLSMWKLLSAVSMSDFDDLMYPTHIRPDGGKYATLREYYEDVSPVHCANLVQTPTIVLTSKDDPVCMHEGAPTDPSQLGPGLIVVKTPYGGHLAYPEGPLPPLTAAWSDRLILAWFDSFL